MERIRPVRNSLATRQTRAGKTKLSTKVVDALLSDARERPGLVAAAYFYCDRNRTDHQEPGQILASFVRQLSFRDDTQAVVGFASDQYGRHQKRGFAASLTSLECTDILTRLVSLYQKVFFVVDGLDECDKGTRHDFMDTLESIRLISTSTVKMFVASRDDGDIKNRYSTTSNLLISVADSQEDIERFVVTQIETSSWVNNPNMESFTRFLWASLHIRELLELQRPKDVREYLEGLPEGILQTYDQMYAKVLQKRGSVGKIATRAFQWLMCSLRPLTPEELVVLAGQDPDADFSFDVDIGVEYLLEACQNLIVVTQPLMPKRAVASFGMGNTITAQSFCRFAHLSVQEYFEQNHWSTSECHVIAAKICLRAMITPSFIQLREKWQTEFFAVVPYVTNRDKMNKERRILLEAEVSLIRYAEDWHIHSFLVNELAGTHRDRFEPSYLRLLKPDSASVLLCVACGLLELVKYWIQEQTVDFNLVTEKGIPLLSIAAYMQQYDMVKMLLELGADPNVQVVCQDQEVLFDSWGLRDKSGYESFSPIDSAVRSRNDSKKRLANITTLLIDHGAQARHSLNGLEYAFASNRKDYATAELLLRHGAGNNELSDGQYWTECFNRRPDWTSINLLLDYGARTHEVIFGSGAHISSAVGMSVITQRERG
ncbi:hypothetical protein PG994_008607 [Apiospora phragmitis]|uniref:Nephrocystin 3-like N-terminal domain-containing protein n=1 Tax=Apiospora phragmitis TaxID=2905665 RepID=A0ABR1UJZ1_9PEZI